MSKTTLKKVELRYRLYIRIIDWVGSVIHRLIPWAGIVFICYLQYLSIRTLAGRTTFASIVIKFLADFHVSEGVAYIFGLGGVGYGLRNRKLRKDAIEHMSERIKSLESQIDLRRTSSQLTKRGDTRPEDNP